MKKLTSGLLIGMILLSSCGNSDTENSSTDSVNNEIENTEENNDLEENQETKPIIEEEDIEERENTTFRNSIWGDSMETVKKYENAKLAEQDSDTLLYTDTLLGMSVNVLYYFDNDKLFETGYIIDENYSNGGQYLQSYNNLKKSLTEIYGEPATSEPIKYETDDLIELAGESKALEYGYIAYMTSWNTDKTLIKLALFYQNYVPTYGIVYTDTSYEKDLSNSGL